PNCLTAALVAFCWAICPNLTSMMLLLAIWKMSLLSWLNWLICPCAWIGARGTAARATTSPLAAAIILGPDIRPSFRSSARNARATRRQFPLDTGVRIGLGTFLRCDGKHHVPHLRTQRF